MKRAVPKGVAYGILFWIWLNLVAQVAIILQGIA